VSADSRWILSGLARLTAWLMEDPAEEPLRRRLFGSFLPLEREGLERTWRLAAELATARVDFLVDAEGRHRALEVNATIPAMQGYSDCVAEAFLQKVARARGLGQARADALVAKNGRNTDELLASLLAHHLRLGGARASELTIAIIARRGDAQRGELEHYARRWSALGHHALIAAPDELRREGDRALVAGRPIDLLYRHIFARRLDPDGEFAKMCLAADRFHVLNPIASHLEVKGMLGLLSQAAAPDGDRFAHLIGLPDEERAAVERAVPWTRILASGPASGPDSERIPELVGWVRENGARLVLKRSWDYGGKSVFLGAELDSPSSQERLNNVIGRADRREPLDWNALCDFALKDGDAWVVQELIAAEKNRELRVETGRPVERALYVDLSAYTNLGAAPAPSGGAVRASESRIVNILGGGGLQPLIRDEVLASLMSDAPGV
jgi:hypothetical protein